MTISLPPLHADLAFNAPLSQERAARLVRFLGEDLRGTVVDVGCGWAELLLRVVAAAPECAGLGLDVDAGALEHGRRLAAQRGLTDRVRLVEADGKDAFPGSADAVICIGASHVWSERPDGSLPMSYAAALRAIRAPLTRGARVAYGEGVWSVPPTAAAAAALGGRLDEFVSVAELVALAVEAGFAPVAVHEASLDEWDAFESGFSAGYAHWLSEHDPQHPDAAEVRARAARQWQGYLGGYRRHLGMAYLHLVAV